MDPAVIRIRYKGLAPGLHGKAERCGRRTTIFLVPGLTSAQRKAALRRLRQEARRGCGPRLPVPQLAISLVADRVRVTFLNTVAVIRLHPAGIILSAVAIGCLMALFVLASVRIIHQPDAAGSGGAPTVSAGAGSPGPGAAPGVTGPGPGPGAGGSGGAGASGKLSRTLVMLSSGSGVGGTGPGSGASAGPGSGSGSGPVYPSVSAGADASVGSAVSVGASTSASAGKISAGVAADIGGTGVSVAASAGPSRSQSPGGPSRGSGISICVDIGPFGRCVGP
jgi:hypothetical protein